MNTSVIARLRHPRARGYEKSYPTGYSPFQAYNDALADVMARLRSDDTRAGLTDAVLPVLFGPHATPEERLLAAVVAQAALDYLTGATDE